MKRIETKLKLVDGDTFSGIVGVQSVETIRCFLVISYFRIWLLGFVYSLAFVDDSIVSYQL